MSHGTPFRSAALVSAACLVAGGVQLLSGTAAHAGGATFTSTGVPCTIVGTSRADRLLGTTGADVICGLGGNDIIEAGAGDDIVDGGAGLDRLLGQDGDDILLGGAGGDAISGGDGDDTLWGGAGNDSAVGDGGDDWVHGDAGNDHLGGGDGSDDLDGGAGHDTLSGGAGDDDLAGGSGDDKLTGGVGADGLDGGEDDDTLSGNAGNDELAGGVGDDHASGGTGDDVVEGDEGNDVLTGDTGNDDVLGDEGSDYLDGGAGQDDCDSDDADAKALSCLYDSTPPTIDAVTISDPDVDVESGDRAVTISARIRDDVSGANWAVVFFNPPAESKSRSGLSVWLRPVSGPRRDRIMSGNLTVPAGTFPGDYTIDCVQAQDYGMNSATAANDEARYGGASGFQPLKGDTVITVHNAAFVADDEGPSITAPELPASVDVTDADVTVTGQMHVSDPSGISFAWVGATAPTSWLGLSDGWARQVDANTWSFSATIPKGTEGGTWYWMVSATDRRNNSTHLERIPFTVVSEHPDMTPAVVTSVEVLTPIVTKRISNIATMRAVVQDPESTIDYCPTIQPAWPDGSIMPLAAAGHVVSSADDGHTLTCSFDIPLPEAAVAGTYSVGIVNAHNHIGRWTMYRPSPAPTFVVQ